MVKHEKRTQRTNLTKSYSLIALRTKRKQNFCVEPLKNSLTEYPGRVGLAGIKYALNATKYGLSVSVSDFSDRMDV